MSKSGADLSRHGVSRSGKVPGQYMNVKSKHLKSRGVGNIYGKDRINSTKTTEHPTRTRARADSGFMGMVHKQRKR